jgi:NAD(P)-dependent dehydrogenase (short-subunit alcohol dehydrogenase family)
MSTNMPGTIIITGANGSLATPATELLLSKYPDYTLILTGRNPETIRTIKAAKNVSIRKLDLSDLSAVHGFATSIASEIQAGTLPPLASIICNAYYWNLRSAPETTTDGLERTFQINHIAHAPLVLRLLGQFDREAGGRVVLFSSDAHWPGKNGLEKIPQAIPDDLTALVVPEQDEKADVMGRGFQLYANSKLAIVMWMYALNRHLEPVSAFLSLFSLMRYILMKRQDLALNKITAVAVNPGNLADSRALRVNTPVFLKIISFLIIRPFLFLLRRFSDPTMRTCTEAAADIVEFATNTARPGERGYYTLSHKDESSPDSLDQARQDALWSKTIEWAGITGENTALMIEHLYVDSNPN